VELKLADDHGRKVNPIAGQLADSHWLLARGPQSLNPIRSCWLSASAIEELVTSFCSGQ
jgi:hypothetical protein